ncbi:ethylbenzene dehydrogenase-related protein [Verrucomicrobiota bacterium]
MKKVVISIVSIAAILFVSGCSKAPNEPATLKSIKTTQKILVDAVAGKAWAAAPAMQVKLSKLPYKPSNGYTGIKGTVVILKSLYDDNNVYFLMQYDDPTKSFARFPWVKQKDGSWKQSMAKDSTGHDNTYYEDKMAFLWNINSTGFEKKGCAASCHMSVDGLVDGIEDSSAGRKFTLPGETIDIWHWKSVRTGPVNQIDDQFMNSDRAEQSKTWGRHGDTKTGGGYVNNINEAGNAPAFMNPQMTEENKYFVLKDSKVPFVDTFKAGQIIPGIIVSAFEGPRADISAKGKWADGKWTIEWKRARVTTGENSRTQDVQFDDLAKVYFFGVAVFDNSQINHLYHEKPLRMVFKKAAQ